jgi:hypothetical protein
LDWDRLAAARDMQMAGREYMKRACEMSIPSECAVVMGVVA